ncbi:MAG: hypothetical protein ACWA5L_07145 [bacterium]
MFTIIFGDIVQAVTELFTNASPVQFGIMAVIALYSSLNMHTMPQIFGKTAQSAVFYGMANFLYGGLISPDRLEWSNWEAQITSSWGDLMAMTGHGLMALMVSFMVMILAIYIIRQMAK